MFELRGKIAVVTGGGSGIGRATAVRLATAGCVVAVVDWQMDSAEETVQLIQSTGGQAHAFQADVSNEIAVQNVAKLVCDELGPAAILVSNAAIMVKTEEFADSPPNFFRLAVDVNLWGVVNCARAFLPQLLLHDAARLVNVSSMGGIIGWMHQVPYCTTKFAVRGFSESLRMELLDTGVRVTCVYPGYVATNVTDNSPTLNESEKDALREAAAKAKPVAPEKVARKILSGIRSGRARVLVCPETHVIDAIARALPGLADRLLHPLVARMIAQGTARPAPTE